MNPRIDSIPRRAPSVPDASRLRAAGPTAMWLAALAVLVALPLVFTGGVALTLMCQIGVMAIFALAYNVLLGGTGLLSFGHAAYFGLGAFATVHLVNAVDSGALSFPVTLSPIAGGIAAALFALVFGFVSVRRAGIAFAMISLGLSELIQAASLSFPQVFGGEGGIPGNRVVGEPGWFGITYASQTQMYYLIIAWAFVTALALRMLSDTPLGRIAAAIRDNPERVEFVGYDVRRVRFTMLIVSAFFSGIAGGLLALSYEMVTTNLLENQQSSLVLMMTYVGGGGHFLGPVIGAALLTLMQTSLSNITPAWLFYFGLLFLLIVLFAPGGIAGIIDTQVKLARAGLLGRVLPWYAALAVPAALFSGGLVCLIETGYACLSATVCGSASAQVAGVPLAAGSAATWLAIAVAVGLGYWGSRRIGARVTMALDDAAADRKALA